MKFSSEYMTHSSWLFSSSDDEGPPGTQQMMNFQVKFAETSSFTVPDKKRGSADSTDRMEYNEV